MPENAEFQSPVHSITPLNFRENQLYQIDVTPWESYPDKDIALLILVHEEILQNTLTKDSPVREVLWLQGCLVDEA